MPELGKDVRMCLSSLCEKNEPLGSLDEVTNLLPPQVTFPGSLNFRIQRFHNFCKKVVFGLRPLNNDLFGTFFSTLLGPNLDQTTKFEFSRPHRSREFVISQERCVNLS